MSSFAKLCVKGRIRKDECTDYKGGASEKHQAAKVKGHIVFHQHVDHTLISRWAEVVSILFRLILKGAEKLFCPKKGQSIVNQSST